MFAPLFVILNTLVGQVRTRDERGASFTEYVVLIGAIVLVVTAGVALLGTQITAKITGLSL